MNRNYWLVGAALLLGACSSAPKTKVEGGELGRSMDQQSIGNNFIESIGIGGADDALTNKTQRMATSRNAAIAAAQHELLTMVKGTNLKGGITVEKAIETDSRISTNLEAVIKGAEIVKTEWTKDDGCVVTMRISKKRLESMMGVQFE